LCCPTCDTAFSIHDAERLAQQKVRLEVFHDPGKVELDLGGSDAASRQNRNLPWPLNLYF
jgi:hypothetical protein